jgi:NADH-quinone oxidoreductase subunit L
MATTLGWIILALPLLGCLALALFPRHGEPPKGPVIAIGVGSILIAFVLSAVVFASMLAEDPSERLHVDSLYEWIDIGGVSVDLAIRIDTLSMMMMLIITGVGFLIHLYSVEYMDHDRDYRRFFAEMNFFVFSMLLLVMAENFVFLIVGWGFVGIASYLLIGYYYQQADAVRSAKKAFVMNVIGDVGMVLAAFLLVRELGTLDYSEVFARAGELGPESGTALAVCLLLFVGAAAKSGQMPLHSWLPDAMTGPTPVSALIHAATMVTAGVYLIVRCYTLFDLSSLAGDTVAVVGMVTLFLAATVALMQVDIKRVLAWSTVSQIGYMVMAAGLGLYASAMFHLMTHAFFKATLFLAAGAVIHALGGEQSLDRMGGLKRHLRVAYFAMGAGCLAIAGFPGFSGFFSKDEILAYSLAAGTLGTIGYVVGTVAALLTAIYMFRLLFRAFFGPDPDGGSAHAPHPSRWWMAVPLSILAVLAVVGGWIQVPFGWHLIDDWLAPALVGAPEISPSHTQEVVSLIIGSIVAVAGIAIAWYLFGADRERRLRLAGVAAGPRRVLEDGYELDEIYDEALIGTTRDLGDALTRDFEPKGAGGIISAPVAIVRGSARVLRAAESGLVRTYAFALIAGVGAAGIVIVLAVVR